jgi:cellulose synthase/poly-beta-1,6-N-acetylglucosamine synthase-like glycosyltransferase
MRIGDRLVDMGLINEADLIKALALQKAWGLRLGETLMALGVLHPQDLARGLARHLGFGLVDLTIIDPDPELLRHLPEEFLRTRFVVPFERVGDRLSLALADPTDRPTVREVEKMTDLQVTPFVTTRWEVRHALERVFRDRYLYEAIERHSREHPAESAKKLFTIPQIVVVVLLVLLNLYWLWLDWLGCLVFWNFVMNAGFFVTGIVKLVLALRGSRQGPEHVITERAVGALSDAELPLYTILLPVYREPEVLPQLFKAIRSLDYPKGKLDVKVLFEEDDRATLEAAGRLAPEPFFEFVVIPTSKPKTKPKACNWGLLFARGEYVTIYDAEDRPEPDQLKKAIVAFRKTKDPRVICVQAALDYYNPSQNFLTKWFTLEYNVWFRLFMPGLSYMRAVIPLGGTSNHFITARLRELGAWDPYNVTEDADLGVRLAARGYRTMTMNSTTWEEANSVLPGWIRQRSRWVKGYMQTYVVHMRHPLKLIRMIGLRHFLLFQLNIGGVPLVKLSNPITVGLLIAWILFRPAFIPPLFPGLIYVLAALNLLVITFLLMYVAIIAVHYSGHSGLLLPTLTLPAYWVLMSVGAYLALYELVVRPFYWQKTRHGLATTVKVGVLR